jgi:hypothetical protein
MYSSQISSICPLALRDVQMTVVVFLHIPKTAGQTIHHKLANVIGKGGVSPIRTHTQALGQSQLPPDYLLHSGHIDWTDLDSLPEDRFVFTVLRDPRERLASFYFYLRMIAQKTPSDLLANGQRPDLNNLLTWSVDDYFFGGGEGWQNFIGDHFDNFYCSYFATQRVRGRSFLAGLDRETILARARAGLRRMDGIYWTDGLHLLERDLGQRLGLHVNLTYTRHLNQGPLPINQPRWPALMDMFETDGSRQRMENLVSLDLDLCAEVEHPAPMSTLRKLRYQALSKISR